MARLPRPRTILTHALGWAVFLLGLWTIPHRWCARGADRYFDGDAATQTALARGVRQWLAVGLDTHAYATGSSRFDGEWLFGSYQMAGLGLAQTALEHPELRTENLPAIDTCIDRLLSEQVKAFDIAAWGNDPIATLANGRGHAAYLGYMNLVLSYRRLLAPNSPHAELSDRITAALASRLAASPILLIESYPGEVYPVDNCAGIGSIALYDRATGADHSALLRRWTDRCRRDYVDPASGMLRQAVDPRTGGTVDGPRGSGTFLGLYFLSFLDDPLAGELYRATSATAADSILGFGTFREYPPGVQGRGDIDSGPVILGHGLSATGFGIAGARMYGDRRRFRDLYATAHLFGAPLDRSGTRHFVSGGPLGDAIMLAMLTAQDPRRLPPRATTTPATAKGTRGTANGSERSVSRATTTPSATEGPR